MEAIKNGSYRDQFPWLMEAGIPVTDGRRYISQHLPALQLASTSIFPHDAEAGV